VRLADASLGELLYIWSSVLQSKLEDEEWISRLPDPEALGDLREQISTEFSVIEDELFRRAEMAEAFVVFGTGHG
jgi:hypothetical protein